MVRLIVSRLFVGIAALLTGALHSAALHAMPITITTADGAGADSFIRGGTRAATNFSTDGALFATSLGGDPSFWGKTYLRFDLVTVTDITAASLDLSVSAPAGGLNILQFSGLNDGAES